MIISIALLVGFITETQFQTFSDLIRHGDYHVNKLVTDSFMTKYGIISEDIIIPPVSCYNIEVINFKEESFGYFIYRVPKFCKGINFSGNVNISQIERSENIEYISINEYLHRSSKYVMSIANKFPNVKMLEIEYPPSSNKGEILSTHNVLDLGVFAKLKNLECLHLFYSGAITNSYALLTNKNIKSLYFTVGRDLLLHSPHKNSLLDIHCKDSKCLCNHITDSKNPFSAISVSPCVWSENGEERTFRMKNDTTEIVKMPDVPSCCTRLEIEGRIDFSAMKQNPNIRSFFWDGVGITQKEINALQMSKFPNLIAVCLDIRTEEECEIDLKKIDICQTIEHMSVSADGRCVIRGMDEAVQNKRIWMFYGNVQRRPENRGRVDAVE